MKKTLLLLFAACAALTFNAQVTTYSVGEIVDDFTVTDVFGNEHNLYSYTAQGKYVMLDFFFDTCGPCQATQPIYNELHDKYGCNQGDLVCLSINNGTDSDAEVIAFEETYGGPYTHAPAISADGGSFAVDEAFGINAYPTYCLIGPDNALVNADIWPIDDITTFENAFPNGSNIAEMPCTVNVVEQTVEAIIEGFYPNPTNGPVQIAFTLESASNVQISALNLIGQEVMTIANSGFAAGENRISADLSALEAGIYLIRLTNGGESQTRRIVVK